MSVTREKITFTRQFHFLDLVPPEIKRPVGPFTADIVDMFLATPEILTTLGKIYIPDFEELELDIFISVFERAFDEGGFAEWSLGSNILFMVNEASKDLDDRRHLSNECLERRVGYSPREPGFRTDIHLETFRTWEKMRSHTLAFQMVRYGRRSDIPPDELSETAILRDVTKFYWSGGDYDRVRMIDLILGQLYLQYWILLKRRAWGAK